ncbi:MAG: class I SAM-dependent methyltransferase [Phycisphaerae bacterium]|nr:class I SAM-dependent methyltransferase [Phycisphaerae bacterium]
MKQSQIAHKLVPIIHEDDHYLFVSKPAGLASQRRPRSRDASVFDLLSGRDDAATLLPLYEVNQWQSGVLGYAKSTEAQQHLLTGLETGSAKPTFVAVVQGKLKPRPQTVTAVIKPVGKDRFAVDHKASGSLMPTTMFKPLKRGATRAMVRCQPTLLNHHQVRAHIESLKLWIVGDAAYHPKPEKAKVGPMMLHLAELRFHHPGLKHAITIWAKTPSDFTAAVDHGEGGTALDGTLTARLRAALAARLPCFLDENTNAFRMLNSRADGVGGLTAELYDDVLILQAHQGKFDAGKTPLREITRWYRQQLDLTAGYVKHFAKDRSRSGSGPQTLRDPKPLVGKPAPEQFVVRENGLRFQVRPYDGYSVGLFLDQRENRRRIRELAGGKSVLNLFCYTCGFSVAAVAGGASSTVNVDISRKSLEWGKENFQANGFPIEDHKFINDDAFNYFKRAHRQSRKFDLVLIDPPSFARAKKTHRVFTLEKDLQRLVSGAVSLMTPGGVLLVSTNQRGVRRDWLLEQIVLGAGVRRVSVIATPSLPIDFAGDPDHAKTIIARVT